MAEVLRFDMGMFQIPNALVCWEPSSLGIRLCMAISTQPDCQTGGYSDNEVPSTYEENSHLFDRQR